jgi:aromatic-L-amino-acid decarboxylase
VAWPAALKPLSNYGMELSRGFKALKVWMSLKEHGVEKYSQVISQNIDQAFYLGELINGQPQLELMAEVNMNIVCFRFNPGGLDGEQLNSLNKELLMRLHESGIAAPSYTLLNGSYVIRAAITNHRTRRQHLDAMVNATVKIGEILMKEFESKLFRFDLLNK